MEKENDGTQDITCMPFDWYEEDNKQLGNVSINAWCKDRNSNSYLVRFVGYTPFVYIELPLHVNKRAYIWKLGSVAAVVKYLQEKMGEDGPISHLGQNRKPVYHYRSGRKKPVIKLIFSTRNAIRYCKNLLKNMIKVPGIGILDCKVWSDDVTSLRQMLTIKEMQYSQWFRAKGTLVTGHTKLSTLKHEYIVDWKTLNPVDFAECKEWQAHPTLLSYDIEAYSDKHNMMPVKTFAKHVSYMISCTFQVQGDRSTRKRFLILMGDCDNLDNSEVIRVADEYELCLAFTNLIKKYDPDIVMGYNTFVFDDAYLQARLERLGHTWDIGGSRLLGKPPSFKSKGWSSKQSRDNIIDYIEFPGRINMDMYNIIKKSHKLPKYTLSYVSKMLLDDDKGDVGYKEMFRIYEKQTEAIDLYERTIEKFVKLGKDEVLDEDLYYISDDLKPIYRENVSEDVIKKVVKKYKYAKSEMSRVSSYCVQDAELVIDLFEHQLVWLGMVAMSNIVGVRIFDVYTRGQQIRGFSQLFDILEKNGYYMDYIEPDDISKFQGAYVGTPIPGLYNYVATLDFNSLYPSIIMAYNICYSTYVPNDVEMSEEEEKLRCHVIEINEDVEHEIEVITKDWDNNDIITKTIEIEHVTRIHRFIKKEYVAIDEEGNIIYEKDENGDIIYEKDKDGNYILDKNGDKIKVKKMIQQHEGFIPRIVKKLVNDRKDVRKQIAAVGKSNPTLTAILDKQQWALKIAANSIYGLLGIKQGRLPFRPGAESTTAKGRELIYFSNDYLERTYNAKVIYGDTDSTMFILPGIDNGADCVRMAKKIEKEISALLPDPLYLEFEKAARMLCIAPKKYAMWKYEPNEYTDREQKIRNPNFGKLYPKDHKNAYLLKGIILARRDNCMWQRRVYRNVLNNLLEVVTMQETLDMIIRECLNFYNGNENYSDLIIIKGLGSNYKDDNYHMKVFADHLKSIGKPATAGERLEYVIVKDRDDGEKLGNKMRAPDTFLERLESDNPEPIDFIYYLEHVLQNCVEQLFNVGYKDELETRINNETINRSTNVINDLVDKGFTEKIMPYWVESENDAVKTVKMITDKDSPIKNKAILSRRKLDGARDIFRPKLLNNPIKQFVAAIKSDRMKYYIEYRGSKELFEELYHN